MDHEYEILCFSWNGKLIQNKIWNITICNPLYIQVNFWASTTVVFDLLQNHQILFRNAISAQKVIHHILAHQQAKHYSIHAFTEPGFLPICTNSSHILDYRKQGRFHTIPSRAQTDCQVIIAKFVPCSMNKHRRSHVGFHNVSC